MTPSTMAINMEIYFPDLSFSSTLSLDGLLLSTDDRYGKANTVEPLIKDTLNVGGVQTAIYILSL